MDDGLFFLAMTPFACTLLPCQVFLVEVNESQLFVYHNSIILNLHRSFSIVLKI